MKYFFIFSLLVMLGAAKREKCFAQQKNFYLIDSIIAEKLYPTDKVMLDSILPLYHKAKHDTVRLKLLSYLSENLEDETLWPDYNQLMLQLTEAALKKLPAGKSPENVSLISYFLNKKASALNNIGFFASYHQGDIPKTLEYYHKSLKIREEIGDKYGIAESLTNIGLIYKDQGDIQKALEYYHKVLEIFEKIDDKYGIAHAQNNIGDIYRNQSDILKAMEYYQKSLKIREEIGDKRGTAKSLNNIGHICQDQAKSSVNNRRHDSLVNKALEYYHKSLKISEEINDKQDMANSLNNIGFIYQHQAESSDDNRVSDSLLNKSLDYYHKGLKIWEKLGAKRGIAFSLCHIGAVYFKQSASLLTPSDFSKGELLKKAMFYVQRSLAVSRELGFPVNIRDAADILFHIYRSQKKWEDALQMHELFIQMRDSIYNEETRKSTFKQQMKYEYEKQQVLKDTEHQKQLTIAAEGKKRQQLIIYAIIAGLLMVVIFSIVVFNRLQVTRKQKIIIETQKRIVDQKNIRITDSINYAKRIQDSILPSHEELSKCFSDYFIFFRPREIVSGDFYWFSSVQNGNSILAIADCTGHGVPGAFMSMIGNALLNEIVNKKNIYQPGDILNHLNDGIVQALHQKSRSQDDGMDISICLFDKEKNKITFAGANHSLYVVQNNSIEEIKGDIYSIGSMFGNNFFSFAQQEIALSKNSSIYFSTDGFADQVGGATGKKFLVKQLKELLFSISSLEIKEQKEEIKETFEEWKGNYAQLDDVLVAGIKI